MQRREALAALASALTGAGCLRLQEAGSTGTRTLRPTRTRTETVTETGTQTSAGTRTETATETATETETAVEGQPVTGLSRSFAYDAANTGYYAVSGPTEKPAESWTRSLAGRIRSVPALLDGRLYVAAGGLHALDASTGDVLWTGDRGDQADPVVGDDLVYAGDGRGIAAYDVTDGQRAWAANGDARGLTLANGRLFAAMSDGLRVFDAGTGSELWSDLHGSVVRAPPAVADGTVVTNDEDGHVRGYATGTGERRWTVDIGSEDDGINYPYFRSAPVISGATVYSACQDYNVYAIDRSSGSSEAIYNNNGSMKPTPAIADGTLYVGGDGGIVAAVDADTGDRKWRTYDNTGSVYSNVVATQNSVFAVDDSGLLVAYDRSNGDVRYKLGLTRSRTRCGPLVTNDWIFVGDGDGTLHAFTTGN
ncbi:PQQ-binding-like beta-propeller repeat protein [Haloarchaeobius sp. TZWSO28]|uniref:outer membrane protein assembly factor BamB family protein n=1 Tax=Haloarchaeobius sp. TZWSO28 TaxID=3446119 RepID=UPI003EB7CE8F